MGSFAVFCPVRHRISHRSLINGFFRSSCIQPFHVTSHTSQLPVCGCQFMVVSCWFFCVGFIPIGRKGQQDWTNEMKYGQKKENKRKQYPLHRLTASLFLCTSALPAVVSFQCHNNRAFVGVVLCLLIRSMVSSSPLPFPMHFPCIVPSVVRLTFGGATSGRQPLLFSLLGSCNCQNFECSKWLILVSSLCR